ncbi:MAG: Folylpolyglutamate synthetase [Caeruleum heppii]|nr:MAG: Folylpolyglutamate synthetase [Caeruleum heppii]
MGRSYGDAVAALNTLQSNFSVVEAIRTSGRGMNKQAIPEMIEWCRKAGYEMKPADFNRLKPIQIAGTKGKGSTSAFVSSILSQYLPENPTAAAHSPKLSKIGLYTSPHLRFVRERIQINNQMLSEEQFARYFFVIWDRLEAAAAKVGLPTNTSAKPVYFRYLTLMAFHAYLAEGVDTAIIEAGIGGEYDSTNILTAPTVTGITSLGIDHTAMLGESIEEIAWHKAGIMKPGAEAFTAPQPAGAMEVLHRRANEKGVTLTVVPRHPDLEHITLGLAADFQKTNASLAIAIAAAHLCRLGVPNIPADIAATSPLPDRFRRGLETVRWGGRCETRRERGITWCIDGGHTMESIEVAGTWFADRVKTATSSPSTSNHPTTPPRILIFNQQTRNAPLLARHLHSTLRTSLNTSNPFTHALFTTNQPFASPPSPSSSSSTAAPKITGFTPDLLSTNTNADEVDSLKVQRGLVDAWGEIEMEMKRKGEMEGVKGTEMRVTRSIYEAAEKVRRVAREWEVEMEGKKMMGGEGVGEVMVLVTGSVHLVGGFLEVLDG